MVGIKVWLNTGGSLISEVMKHTLAYLLLIQSLILYAEHVILA